MTPVECWYVCVAGALLVLLGFWLLDIGYAQDSRFLQGMGVVGGIMMGFGLIIVSIGYWIGG